jgi:hypothetical protein
MQSDNASGAAIAAMGKNVMHVHGDAVAPVFLGVLA